VIELLLLAGLGAGTLSVLVWNALKKSANAPLEQLPPPERPKQVLTAGDRVLQAVANKYHLRNEVDVVRGRVDGAELVVAARPDGTMPTRFEARVEFEKPLGLGLEVTPRRRLAAVAERDAVVNGDFDARFEVTATHLDQARTLLAGAVAQHLSLADQKAWDPRLNDEQLTFSVDARRGEDDARRAVDRIVTTARALELARSSVQRPDIERRVLDAFDVLAKARGGELSRADDTLVIDAEVGRLELDLRSAGSYYETHVALELARPLGVELTIRLESERSMLQRWRSPDIAIGIADFDAKFVVRGEPEDEVRSLLAEPVRSALLALADRVSWLSLDSQQVAVLVGKAIPDAEALGSLLDAVLRVATALSPPTHRGAYR
jgi:hypothetical protein